MLIFSSKCYCTNLEIKSCMKPRTRIEEEHFYENCCVNFNISMTHMSVYTVFFYTLTLIALKCTKYKYNESLSHFIGFYNPLKVYTRWKTTHCAEILKLFQTLQKNCDETSLFNKMKKKIHREIILKTKNTFEIPVSSIRVYNPWAGIIIICSPESDI